ncbi:MAG TPA: hypothetical protein VHW60_15695 [Caulobacteraceae bacterium]|nr:hypothetical protein [Caulobacteraceae bacterium]
MIGLSVARLFGEGGLDKLAVHLTRAFILVTRLVAFVGCPAFAYLAIADLFAPEHPSAKDGRIHIIYVHGAAKYLTGSEFAVYDFLYSHMLLFVSVFLPIFAIGFVAQFAPKSAEVQKLFDDL